ncbi:MAG: hypothetical protein GSR84_03180 [Desulfurococcales archaeon]|nr:hypothetical protein [Desulfurococcales archaeon]
MEQATILEDTAPPKLVWVKPLHQISIVGTMGSGKTTLARYLYSRYRWGRAKRGVVSVYFQFEREKIDVFWETLESLDAYYAYIVIDDISFSLSRGDREFLHRLAKIRHANPSVKRWVVVTIMHYSRATLPFIRQSHSKILTSLADPEEIEQLRWSFKLESLWDYYDVYRTMPTSHWALFNWLGNIFITRFPRPRRRCWDIVVSGPECV